MSGPAAADPLASARDRARVLQAQLEALEVQTESGIERYDAAQAALQAAVTRRLTLQTRLDLAQGSARSHDRAGAARVRALYMDGGSAALGASMLRASTPADLLERAHTLRAVLATDRSGSDRSEADVVRAQQLHERATAAARAQTELTLRLASLADRVRVDTARTQALMAGADARVLAMAQQRAAAERLASEQAFAARVAAARLALPPPTGQAAPASVPSGPGPALGDADDAPSRAVATVLQAARDQVGKPYLWGASGPDGFDCSGLTGFAYAAAGIVLPRTSAAQYAAGDHPGLGDLRPGDLLFWASDPADPRTIHHVALYLGGGQMVASPHSGDVVKVQPVYASGFLGATRVLNLSHPP